MLLLAHGLRALSGVFVGDLLILGAVTAWVFYTAEGKAFIGEHGALRATAWSMIAGALLAPPARALGAPSRSSSSPRARW